MRRESTLSRSRLAHRTFFDVLKDKHPDLAAATEEEAAGVRHEAQRGGVPIFMTGLLLAATLLVWLLRPSGFLGEVLIAAWSGDGPTVAPAASWPRATKPADRHEEPVSPARNVAPPPAVRAPSRPQVSAAELSGRPAVERPAPVATFRSPPPASAMAGETPSAVAAPNPAATLAPAAFRPATRIFAPPPEYPEAARLAGQDGAVVVEAQIDAGGAVTGTSVIRGRSPALDRAARATLERWRFEPATLGGAAVESAYRIAFRFALEKAPAAVATPVEVAGPARPLELGGDIEPPAKVLTPIPDYPDAAWAAGVTGDVLVRATIDERGAVADVEVVKGLPYGITEAAVEAIRRWRFRPATLHGEPVAVYHNLSIRFAP